MEWIEKIRDIYHDANYNIDASEYRFRRTDLVGPFKDFILTESNQMVKIAFKKGYYVEHLRYLEPGDNPFSLACRALVEIKKEFSPKETWVTIFGRDVKVEGETFEDIYAQLSEEVLGWVDI